MTGLATPLMGAMLASTSRVVALLLEYGVDPYESDIGGNDAFMFASIFGRTDNVKFWLKQFPDWDLERKNKVVGGVALGQAVYMGPHRLELVKVLLEHGASVTWETDGGSSILTALCSSEDAEPDVLEYILEMKKVNVPLTN